MTIQTNISLLHQANDLPGKVLIPFSTNGGWPGHTIKDIKDMASKAGATAALDFQVQFDSTGGDQMQTSEKAVADWAVRVKDFLDERINFCKNEK